ncbi:MAG: rhamnogalacturonan lyase [Pedobacter sp.]|nr:MAG: rhamnogalacturonan lyase [Pedobacter sp.]
MMISSVPAFAQRHMEKLGRGVVAVRQGADSVFVSWRILGTEPDDIAFNLYRKAGNTAALKLNKNPITKGTNFQDVGINPEVENSYFVKVVKHGQEEEASKPFILKAKTPVQQYLNIPLKPPAGYTPNDASVGDLDGDGEYEIVLHQTGRSRDNSSNGVTDPPIFQAYKIDGTFLWEINLGKNIREGAHYTQFMVYDLDGDGIAEFACKTADGTVDGKGKVIGDSTKDYRNKNGRILEGPEFFTVFSGKTGEALATTAYLPGRGDIGTWGGRGGNGKNDNSGNRVDRFTACIAYLDGIHPSVVMARGDEIIFGSMCVDDNGKGLYTTGLRHGDALHVSDLDPERPGLEVFGVHEIEEGTKGPGAAVYDAKTGEILWHGSDDEDVGRGVADNIDNTRVGAQMWWSGSNGLFDIKGNRIGEQPRSTNFLIYWDGDLSRELLDGNHIDKYNGGRLLTANGAIANNWTKSTPSLSADIFGDWREELMLRSYDNQSLRIYTTTIPTEHRNYTLMHDPQYRLSIAWQNVGYNQPPHTGFLPKQLSK